MWRRIRLRHVNVVLYLLIGGLVILYWNELNWAWVELPKYLRGDIGQPDERGMYRQARDILWREDYIADAQPLLERSVAIDPWGEAVYWLGEYFFETGQDDEALRQFERYVEIDPAFLPPYLKISAIFEKRDRLEPAVEVLRRGLSHFGDNLDRYEPRLDESVRSRFNDKAARVHEYYRAAVRALRMEIERLEKKRERPARAGGTGE